MPQLITPRFGRERGVTATEYALIVAAVTLVMLLGAQLLGTNLSDVFSSVAGDI